MGSISQYLVREFCISVRTKQCVSATCRVCIVLPGILVLNLCIKELKVRIVVAVEGETVAVHAVQSHSEEVKAEAMLLAVEVMLDAPAHHHQAVRVVLVAHHHALAVV